MKSQHGQVTSIIAQIDAGDASARGRLLELAYDELRSIAQEMMNRERADHTLEPTALVHEAAIRLMGPGGLQEVKNRAYFFGAMARAMRQILVDHARRRAAIRRGGDRQRVSLDVALDAVESSSQADVLQLDDLLIQLELLDARQCDVVMRRFFCGQPLKEIAADLGVSLSTIEGDWRIARAWLRGQLHGGEQR